MRTSCIFFRKSKSVVAWLLIAGLATSLFVSFGLAKDPVDAQSLEVSPPSQELKADPGQQLTVKAKLRNKSFSTVNIKVRIEDFTATGQEGQVALLEKNNESLKSWSLLSTENFSLKPNEVREVIALINVPDTVAGGQYGSFVFSIVNSENTPGSAAISQEIASLFLIRVRGEERESLILSDFIISKFFEFGPVPMQLKFKNSGNVHIKPFGLINVRNIFGKTVGDVVIKGETNILPGATRVVRVSLDKKFLFGFYTAEALLNYGVKNESLSSVSTFFVFPVRVVVLVLVIILVLYKARKRLMRAFEALAGK